MPATPKHCAKSLSAIACRILELGKNFWDRFKIKRRYFTHFSKKISHGLARRQSPGLKLSPRQNFAVEYLSVLGITPQSFVSGGLLVVEMRRGQNQKKNCWNLQKNRKKSFEQKVFLHNFRLRNSLELPLGGWQALPRITLRQKFQRDSVRNPEVTKKSLTKSWFSQICENFKKSCKLFQNISCDGIFQNFFLDKVYFRRRTRKKNEKVRTTRYNSVPAKIGVSFFWSPPPVYIGPRRKKPLPRKNFREIPKYEILGKILVFWALCVLYLKNPWFFRLFRR